MYCENCGAALPEGARFCGECGAPVTQKEEPAAPTPKPAEKAPAAPAAEPKSARSARPEAPAQPPKKAKRKINWGASILVFCIIFAVGYGARWLMHKIDPLPAPTPTPMFELPEIELSTPAQNIFTAPLQTPGSLPDQTEEAPENLQEAGTNPEHIEYDISLPGMPEEVRLLITTFYTAETPEYTEYLTVYYNSLHRQVTGLIVETQFDAAATGLTVDAVKSSLSQLDVYVEGTGYMVYENNGRVCRVCALMRLEDQAYIDQLTAFGFLSGDWAPPLSADDVISALNSCGLREVPEDVYSTIWID